MIKFRSEKKNNLLQMECPISSLPCYRFAWLIEPYKP